MHIERDQEGRAGTPCIVDLDVADPNLGAAQGEVPGFVRRAVGRGEHEPGVLSDVVRGGPVAGLLFGAELEHGDADAWQRQGGF